MGRLVVGLLFVFVSLQAGAQTLYWNPIWQAGSCKRSVDLCLTPDGNGCVNVATQNSVLPTAASRCEPAESSIDTIYGLIRADMDGAVRSVGYDPRGSGLWGPLSIREARTRDGQESIEISAGAYGFYMDVSGRRGFLSITCTVSVSVSAIVVHVSRNADDPRILQKDANYPQYWVQSCDASGVIAHLAANFLIPGPIKVFRNLSAARTQSSALAESVLALQSASGYVDKVTGITLNYFSVLEEPYRMGVAPDRHQEAGIVSGLALTRGGNTYQFKLVKSGEYFWQLLCGGSTNINRCLVLGGPDPVGDWP